MKSLGSISTEKHKLISNDLHVYANVYEDMELHYIIISSLGANVLFVKKKIVKI